MEWGKKGACRLCFIGRALQVVEDEWRLFHERVDNPERFLKNKEKKALVYWKTENVLTKVIELLIGFEALGEFYSPTGKLLEFRELVAIAEQVWGIRIKNFRQLKSRVLKRYKEKTVLDQMERLIEKLREQEYK
ncbi:MAG: hypothetical protein KHW86_15315 [Porphyromonadaceae bacterium]|nr:hypothetical protein [Porphyromonadaceae bacterium]